jgi:hypothetical protein
VAGGHVLGFCTVPLTPPAPLTPNTVGSQPTTGVRHGSNADASACSGTAAAATAQTAAAQTGRGEGQLCAWAWSTAAPGSSKGGSATAASTASSVPSGLTGMMVMTMPDPGAMAIDLLIEDYVF